jgi:ferredoxin
MALIIDCEKCTGCGTCQPACDINNAIYESRLPDPEECEHCDVCIGMNCDYFAEGDVIYGIDPDRCTECIQDSDAPKCVKVCPINDCIVPDEYRKETKEQLLEKRQKMAKQN